MANVSETTHQMAISRIPQTNYLTATTPAATAFVEQVMRARTVPNVTSAVKNNKGYSTGQRFATESWKDMWTSEFSFDFDVSSQNIGRYLYAVMGSYSVAVVTGAAGAYKHTFLPLDVSVTSQLPSYGILAQNQPGASYINSLFPSMNCASLTLTSGGAERVSGATSWTGSGEEIIPSGAAWATHVTKTQGTQNYFYNTQSSILADVDAAGTGADAATSAGTGAFTTCDLTRWNFGISNTFSDDPGCPRYKVAGDPESGTLRSHHQLIDTTFDYGFSLKLRASDPAYNLMLSQASVAITNTLLGRAIAATTAKHRLDVIMNLTKYQSAARSYTDGFGRVDISPDILLDTTANQIVKIELTNNIASYAI